MKILVTGSTGQVGSYLMDIGQEQGHQMRGLDIRPHHRWTEIVADVRDVEACSAAFKGVDAVIHCAAQIDVQASIKDPAADASTNVLGTINLLQACADSGVSRFVNVSSAAVYGNPESVPINEDHPLRPLSPYGASKAAAEVYARMFRELHSLEVVTARPFNIYSPRQDPTNPYSGVISKFVEATQRGEPPVIYGDGSQTRDFVHACDVASALLSFATGAAPRFEIMNLGTGHGVTIRTLAESMAKSAAASPTPAYRPAREGDILHSVADVARAASVGWQALVSLSSGLAEMM